MSLTLLLRERMVEALEQLGFVVFTAYPKEKIRENQGFLLLSIEKLEQKKLGFSHYLGEKFVAERQSMEEIYGASLAIGFGLTVCAPKSGGTKACQDLCEKLMEVFPQIAPADISLDGLGFEGLSYDREHAYFKQKGLAEGRAMVYCLYDETGTFEYFDVKGGVIVHDNDQ